MSSCFFFREEKVDKIKSFEGNTSLAKSLVHILKWLNILCAGKVSFHFVNFLKLSVPFFEQASDDLETINKFVQTIESFYWNYWRVRVLWRIKTIQFQAQELILSHLPILNYLFFFRVTYVYRRIFEFVFSAQQLKCESIVFDVIIFGSMALQWTRIKEKVCVWLK